VLIEHDVKPPLTQSLSYLLPVILLMIIMLAWLFGRCAYVRLVWVTVKTQLELGLMFLWSFLGVRSSECESIWCTYNDHLLLCRIQSLY